MKLSRIWAPALLALFVAGCQQESTPPTLESDVDSYAAAVDHPARTDVDRARDSSRQPAAVLRFLGVTSGMTVLDLFSGGGYYSELVSYVVGNEGAVTSHSNEAYLGFVGDEFSNRHADGRLPNVTVLMAENNELDLEPDSFDAVLMMLTFHDLYYIAPQQGWPKIDGEHLLAEIFQGLRPGGFVGIVDHYAEAGAAKETGNTLHRIDPSIVIAEMEAAGFELVAKSDMLRSMNDDYSKVVFDPAVSGKTDRFLLKFEKPE